MEPRTADYRLKGHTLERGGGGTHPSFGDPLQNGPSHTVGVIAVKARKRGGKVVSDPTTLKTGAVRGGLPCGGCSS